MDISLSKGVRSNLLHLQMTADLMGITQERLATGKKINSALDNPTNFFTAASLNSRSNDISLLMDGMTNGIKTIEAADNGIKAITKTVESMQSTLRQARQDKSFKSTAFENKVDRTGVATTDKLTFKGGSVGNTAVEIKTASKAQGLATAENNYSDMDFNNGGVFGANLTFVIATNGGASKTVLLEATNATTMKIYVAGTPTTMTVSDTNAVTKEEMRDLLNAGFDTVDAKITAGLDGSKLTFTADESVAPDDAEVKITGVSVSGAPVLRASFGAVVPVKTKINFINKTVQELVDEINTNSSLKGKVEAKLTEGKLRIKNISTSELTITGADSSGVTGKSANTSTISGNEIRKNLINQFNELHSQLDKLAEDASYNGINLLDGDKLKLTFNETGTSQMEIQAKNSSGTPTSINNAKLGIETAVNGDFDLDSDIDSRLEKLSDALGKLRSHAATFGTNLSIVQNRTDFSKHMMNTLKTGADNLTLADGNEEAANMLALKTRQQLSTSALSMASQADQAILRLFS